ncbi:Hypothetical protein PBC10988_0360 [Planctomycetales bacterium 10988]|nr:Hypothetical protein PBC10988_0360 [Planctomycetales bacterium 10988]
MIAWLRFGFLIGLFFFFIPSFLSAQPSYRTQEVYQAPTDRVQVWLPSGDAVIRGSVGEDEIVITTTSRVSGAIDSLTFRGKEFIDSYDHGRQLQSALNLDAGTPIAVETYNPTEAGSRRDGLGPRSSSRLLHLIKTENSLQTTTQMAFWVPPGEYTLGQLAKNETLLSNFLVTKSLTIGDGFLKNVIPYTVTFTVPLGEWHTEAVFEALTGYMPPEFDQFWKYYPDQEALAPLSQETGEQAYPVVLATKSGDYAMGIYSPDQPSPGYEHIGYGRFLFEEAKVTKWNCVFRFKEPVTGIEPGPYTFRMFVIVGDLEMVEDSMRKLHQRHELE